MPSSKTKVIMTPTEEAMDHRDQENNNGFHHLLPKLRYGKVVSDQIFSRREVLRLSVDPDVLEEGRRKKTENAVQEQEAAPVPVREIRESVGEKAPLRQGAEETVKKARARKKTVKDDK